MHHLHRTGATEEKRLIEQLVTDQAHPGLPRAQSRMGLAAKRIVDLNPLELASLVALAGLVVALLLAPLFLSHGPLALVDVPLKPPSGTHLLGTDQQGRDVLTRVAYGMRASWFAALAVIASGILIGGAVGLVAGITGGFVDGLLMRLTDLFLALPGPLLVLAIVAALGPSLHNTLIGIAVIWWPLYARIVRGQVRATVVLPHVEAARLGGISRTRVALKHVLPGSFGPILVAASLDIGNLVLLLAALSFLGLGTPEPAPELGAMTSQGLTYLFTSWWVAVCPAAGVFALAFIGNLAGDAVRDLIGA
jgi:ABC-type dipeptide/oligopeptide/nickel transport system permease subunit